MIGLRQTALAGALVAITWTACAQILSGSAASPEQIAGVWRGTSECQVKDSPCRDEVNVYRISLGGKPGWFTVTGAKIVEGREVVMGTSDWQYDAAAHTLSSQGPAGRFRLTINGSRMDGTLTLTDSTVFRRIHLERENGAGAQQP